MATITIPCPCGKTIEVDSSWAGKAGRCKACGTLHQVPEKAKGASATEPRPYGGSDSAVGQGQRLFSLAPLRSSYTYPYSLDSTARTAIVLRKPNIPPSA